MQGNLLIADVLLDIVRTQPTFTSYPEGGGLEAEGATRKNESPRDVGRWALTYECNSGDIG